MGKVGIASPHPCDKQRDEEQECYFGVAPSGRVSLQRCSVFPLLYCRSGHIWRTDGLRSWIGRHGDDRRCVGTVALVVGWRLASRGVLVL